MPAAERTGRARHRVLIAAFLLPETIEFDVHEDEGSGSDPGLMSVPASPMPRQPNPQHLADVLSSRLQMAVNQQDTARPVRPSFGAHIGSSATSPRRGSFTGQRERVNMAELMAEATGPGSTFLSQQVGPGGSAVFSGASSPPQAEPTDDDAGATHAQNGGVNSAPDPLQPVVKNSLSDHGRHADGLEGSVEALPGRASQSSRRNSMTGSNTFLKPLGLSMAPPSKPASPQPGHSRGPAPRAPGVQGEQKTGTPVSIISDLAAKQSSKSSIATPARAEQNPFGAGVVTPMPPMPHGASGRASATPLLMSRPELASGWTSDVGASQERNASVRNAQRHQEPAPGAGVGGPDGRPLLRPRAARSTLVPPHTPPASATNASPQEMRAPSLPGATEREHRAEEDTAAEGHGARGVRHTEEAREEGDRQDADGKVPSARIRRGGSLRDEHKGRRLGRRHTTSRSVSKRSRSVSIVGTGGTAPEDRAEPGFHFLPNPGANYGLINAVNSVAVNELRSGKKFIGTLGIEMDWIPERTREAIDARAGAEYDCEPVWLRDQDYVSHYHRYCKQILWPTFHYTLPSGDGLANEHEAFRAYVEVNRRFADRIVELYEDGDLIWVQDYHLLLVPQMVRERLPRAAISLFVHIAFPSSEIFRCLGTRERLLRGMLGADLVGFQTHNFCRHFRQTVSRILQLEATPRGIQLPGSFVTVAPFPIGIDVNALDGRRENPEVLEWVQRLQERYAGKFVIVGRDKLDWIKGVREKLLGFEMLLDMYPEWDGRVVLVQVALATVQEDREVGEATDIVARINRKHSSFMYQPVVFLHVQEITFSQYLALLTMADVFIATSLREGMNLTSHEYVIAQESRKRPLVLSEFTGTYSALRACIGVNPWNTRQVAEALQRALTMPEKEMSQRWYDLHRTVVTQTAQHWITSVLSQLERAHQRKPMSDNLFIPRLEIAQLVSEWRAAKSRLLLLDLEHTLVLEGDEDAPRADVAPPTVVHALRRLSGDPKTYVYLLSARSMQDLDKIASLVPGVGLIAEDGCYVRHPDADPTPGAWTSLIDGFELDWRTPVLEILTYFTERTPGASIELRSASICWNFPRESGDASARQWARRQAAEVQSLIYDSLGERSSLRIVHDAYSFVIMPKNVSRTTAVQYLLSLDSMGALPPRLPHGAQSPSSRDDRAQPQGARKGMFAFVLQIGRDEDLVAYVNQLDLAFAPRTCTTLERKSLVHSDASHHLAPGAEVVAGLEEIVDFRLRDLRWGGPAMLDV
ncbi:hypothetical protein MSPP1_001537 [Malassezia sp. CBS 17886]|nr:hypothetical protein MSPP1_001537 [Malassezia sp. CBS 17886]